jgi:hypothetical protein
MVTKGRGLKLFTKNGEEKHKMHGSIERKKMDQKKFVVGVTTEPQTQNVYLCVSFSLELYESR